MCGIVIGLGLVKWFMNRSTGIPAYITVDMKTQNTKIVRLEDGKGIQYSQQAYFNDNLLRHVRFHYPCDMLGDPHFELDESGNPYWVYGWMLASCPLSAGTACARENAKDDRVGRDPWLQ